ncbi:AAA family ATPase [Sphingobacterium sp. 2149]|uniref:AAA family ATPase n=1 Tax=Sphingobacterium sp. 2149 TaxID=2817763 RepID=UPI002863FCE6|nr:AAA family ATPase [Sphingobacterium sp. 2149]MDR6734913.1 DNA polymerase III delta prime subunit [Sphingobacterium sp. 2149]
MLKKKSLKEYLNDINVWYTWRDNYRNFVPKFVEEAKKGLDYSEWNRDIFYEFFERSNDQCVSSLRQGYFNSEEKVSIKNNWGEISPILKTIAEASDVAPFDDYEKLKKIIRKYTTQDRRAATNRLIASIQPKFLCTIVNHGNLNTLISYLNANVLNANITLQNNWFESSNEVLNFFLKEGEFENVYDMITYPWQLFEYFNENNHVESTDMGKDKVDNEIVGLLKYKKQIILQGPPGTGKTREAKIIAKDLIGSVGFDQSDMSLIMAGEYFKTKTDKVPFLIKGVSESQNYFKVKSDNASNEYTVNFKQVIDCLNAKGWEDPTDKWNSHGNSSYLQVIAKIIYERKVEKKILDQVKVIQFHPSYTYEDFVRGIVAKPSGDGIIYEAENKVIGMFAQIALDNYLASKENHVGSDETDVFNAFIDSVKEQMAQSEDHKFNITDRVYLFSADETRFKYKGDNWVAHDRGLNMKFSELKKIIVSGAGERQDIKKISGLEELTRQHATYFNKVVEKYYEFKKKFDKSDLPQENEKLKNYVLIIDEINRANLSSVLGELIYALEYRGESVESMYAIDGANKLVLPPNLYIIGTMNTADRSVGHIDYAIRRRFAFVDIIPKDLSEEEGIIFDTELFNGVSKLFDKYLSPEFEKKDVQLGHSYFIDKSEEGGSMLIRLEYEIKPILLEYVKDGVLIGDGIQQAIQDLKSSM